MRLSPLDLSCALLSSPKRPLDFAVRLELAPGAAPTLDELLAGAVRAQVRFPRSACVVSGASWAPAPKPGIRIGEESAASAPDALRHVEAFLDEPLDITTETGIRQLLVRDPATDRVELVARMHHALGDYVSLMLWLDAQLSRPPLADPGALRLKRHPAPRRRSPFAFVRPSPPLRPARRAAPSGRRRWRTIAVASAGVAAILRREARGFTYNDLLCAAVLETAREWNGGPRVALWHPVNVREIPFEGFGNGSSRIRVYHRRGPGTGYASTASAVREQIAWSKRNGEWSVPDESSAIFRLPFWLLKPAVLAFANRPGVDYGSLPFSHVEHLAPGAREPEFVSRVRAVEGIAPLHDRHPMAIAAAGFGGRTWLTLTWDDALFGPGDVDAFLSALERHLGAAFREVLRG